MYPVMRLDAWRYQAWMHKDTRTVLQSSRDGQRSAQWDFVPFALGEKTWIFSTPEKDQPQLYYG